MLFRSTMSFNGTVPLLKGKDLLIRRCSGNVQPIVVIDGVEPTLVVNQRSGIFELFWSPFPSNPQTLSITCPDAGPLGGAANLQIEFIDAVCESLNPPPNCPA